MAARSSPGRTAEPSTAWPPRHRASPPAGPRSRAPGGGGRRSPAPMAQSRAPVRSREQRRSRRPAPTWARSSARAARCAAAGTAPPRHRPGAARARRGAARPRSGRRRTGPGGKCRHLRSHARHRLPTSRSSPSRCVPSAAGDGRGRPRGLRALRRSDRRVPCARPSRPPLGPRIVTRLERRPATREARR